MNRFRSLQNQKVMLTALVLVLGAALYVASMPSSDAVVVPGPGVTIYFSSAAMTTVVGARGTGCCGSVINWGITTKWKRFEKIYCTDQVCPN